MDLAPFFEPLVVAYQAGTLPPTTLRDVAERAGCSVATVSRYAASHTFPFQGEAVPCKALFTSALQGESGAVSSRLAREAIRAILDAAPGVSDQVVSDLLWSQYGVRCARRTVNKYRSEDPHLSV